MATVPAYGVESATSGVSFPGGNGTHVMVLTDATNIIATLGDDSTVDFGDALAGTILKGDIVKIAFDTGTFRVFHVT